ncbi:MAG: hypothetical protein JWQ38_1092 [Flavipsychrobacter sp.]|nr:hypothetical protein [Flavipsychrobacter sp.]
MKHLLFLLTATICIFCSCHSIFDKKGTDVYVIDDLKNGFNFQYGSYWIYTDALTGQVDSFYVKDNHQGMSYNTPNDLNDQIRDHYIDISITEENTAPLPVSAKKESWSMHLSENFISFYGSHFYYQQPETYQQGTTSYTINGQTYNNVSVIIRADTNKVSTYGSAANYYDTIYLCPKVGVIRIAMYHPLDTFQRVWELQRYKVY